MAADRYPLEKGVDVLKIAERFGSTSTLRRILRIALRLGAGSCVVEEETGASCEIYEKEYERAYSKQFAKHETACTRLHFLRPKAGKTKTEECIGFCTLRPRRPASITHAVLPPPHGKYAKQRDNYCLCSSRLKLNSTKSARSKTLAAFPFIQQDGLYDRCAHVALLAINWYLASKRLSKKVSISDIVDWGLEIPSPGRDFPSEGLGVLQITHVFKRMGMSPLVYAYPPEEGEFQFPPQRLIYHYIESGLPALVGIPLGITGHAVVVIGHTVSPDNWWPIASEKYYEQPLSGGLYHCSTTWIDNFIISDDNLGPYLTIDKNFFEAKAKEKLVIVVALPKDVLLKGEDAEVYAYNSLSAELRGEIANLSPDCTSHLWAEHFWDHYLAKSKPHGASDIVLRTFLQQERDVKKSFEEDDYPEDLKNLVSATPLPPHVWVTELSTPGLFAQERRRLGRVVLDATGDPRSSKNLLLIRHLPGLMHCRNAKTEVTSRYVFEDDHPRGHLSR